MKRIFKKALTFTGLGLIAALSSPVYAAGYKLEFQSPSVLADAGEAAVVEDAGTNWYNAAGLVYLPQQVVGAITDVYQQTKFSGTSTASSPVPGYPGYNNTNSDASSYPNVILPAFHYTLPFHDRYAVAISVVPAWGLMEDYGETSDVRYNLNKITTKTIDVSPSFAMKINDHWSLGLGPDFHYFSLQSRSHVYTQPLTGSDSISRYTANNWGTGWHAGILLRLNEATRIGLAYRSKLVMNMSGNSDFALTNVAANTTDQFKTNIPLPPVTTLSIYRDINPVWAVMGTIAYDQWSVIQYYYGQNFAGPQSVANPSGLTNVVLRQNFHDAFNFSIGTHYKWNDKWMLRAALKLENTPTITAYRAVSFPDSSKMGLNIGARYQVNPKVAIDMILAHVFCKQTSINDVNPSTGATSVGHVNNDMNIAGAQVVWSI